MNKEIFEKYADKLLTSMKAEKLMNKEVAEIFHVFPSYMTNMSKRPEKVPVRFMEMIREWAISGKPLKDYQPPAVSEAQPPEPEATRDGAEMKFRSKLATKRLVKQAREEIMKEVGEVILGSMEPPAEMEGFSPMMQPLTKEETAVKQAEAAIKKTER